METRKEQQARYFQKVKNERPWVIAHHNAKCRCLYKSTRSYHRYGGRGIKCLLSVNDVKRLWIRDGACDMKCASLDRIDNNGNYTYSNCRFIEKSENTLRKPVYRPKNCASKYLGVCRGRYGKWLAQIQINKQRIWIGEFDTQIKAHRAYLLEKSKIRKLDDR